MTIRSRHLLSSVSHTGTFLSQTASGFSLLSHSFSSCLPPPKSIQNEQIQLQIQIQTQIQMQIQIQIHVQINAYICICICTNRNTEIPSSYHLTHLWTSYGGQTWKTFCSFLGHLLFINVANLNCKWEYYTLCLKPTFFIPLSKPFLPDLGPLN